MNIEEKIDFLRKRHPAFGRKVMHDVNAQGEEFCEIIYPNENNDIYIVKNLAYLRQHLHNFVIMRENSGLYA